MEKRVLYSTLLNRALPHTPIFFEINLTRYTNMKTEIKNYNANKFTKELEHLIIRNGYRILSVQSGGINNDTEVIVLTKAEDLSQADYSIRLLFKRHESINIDTDEYYAWGADKMTIAYADTEANNKRYGWWDSLYHRLDKTILYETFEYEGHFFKNEKDFREYIKDSLTV